MFVAWSPFGPVVMSKETFWFSFRLLKPDPWIAEKCANRGEVREHVLAAAIGGDEAKAFRIVKPLDGSGCHVCCLSNIN